MNNALIQDAEWQEIDLTPNLQERKAVLLRLISAIAKLSANEDWQTIKELLFDGQAEKLEKQLLIEAKSSELNASRIHRLNGNLEWAKRYDLYKLAEAYKLELNQITKKLNQVSGTET